METLTPHLYALHRFTYGKQNSGRTTLMREKTQYVYRFLIFEEGDAVAILNDRRYLCRAGDLLYLPPGQYYRLSADAPFSVLQVSFDLFGGASEDRPLFCVFTSEFSAARASPLPTDASLAPLCVGSVFSRTTAPRSFFELLTEESSPLWRLLGDSALCTTLADILRMSTPPVRSGEDILAYINTHPEEKLTAKTLAAHFSYHPNYINALVKRASGLSLGAYLRRRKIAYACELLSRGGLSPLEVAGALGYYDYSHFYKAFRAETGLAPGEYIGGGKD